MAPAKLLHDVERAPHPRRWTSASLGNARSGEEGKVGLEKCLTSLEEDLEGHGIAILGRSAVWL